MKILITLLTAIFCIQAQAKIESHGVAITRIYAPIGFDSNDNAQVVVEGVLSNTCYMLNEPMFTISGSRIYVEQTAWIDQNKICLAITAPFYKVVNLGRLKPGYYEVLAGEGLSTVKDLKIDRPNTDNVDDYLYAPILDGFVRDRTLLLKGEFPDPSYSIERVDVRVFGDTVVVLPIMKKDQGLTIQASIPFEISVDLSRHVEWNSSYLIHVRAMNGNSINLVEHFLK